MLLLQCRHEASFPQLDTLAPNGKMEILLIFLGLLGNSIAMPMHMPRMPGFSSKSEEMMRYGQFNFMNSPHLAHLNPMYGNVPQQFPQYQMPMWPQPPPNTWHLQKPLGPKRQNKTDPTQETQKPNQTPPKKPPQKRPLKQPPRAPPEPKEETQPPQAFPPFNNGLFPYQQPPWQIPQRMPPPGYGRPPVSNEEGGNPYFGYFGYHGFGGRPPYYSEEMFEQDFEKPKEEDPPKKESPGTEPTANSTVTETNSTQPNTRGSQAGNDTSPTGNAGSNPTVQNGVIPPPTVNASGQGVPGSQIPWRPSQPNIRENYPNPNVRRFPSGRPWYPTGTVTGHRQNGPFYRTQQVQRGPRWNSYAWENKQAARPGNPTYHRAYPSTSRGNYPNYARNLAHSRRKPQGPNKHPMGTSAAPLSPKPGTVDRNEKTQTPREKPLGQKERVVIPTKIPTGPWRNSQHYEVNKSNYKPPPPESNTRVPNFNSIDQRENSYYPREDSRRIPNSDGPTQSQNLPKGIVLEPRRIPYGSETNQPELKPSTYQPVYLEEIPSPAREHFPTGRNTWTHQETPPPFKEDPRRREEHLPHPSHGSRGNVFYPEYTPYDPRENSPYLRSNTWDERDDSPNTMRQQENPLYPINIPDQKETVPYNEEDPVDPIGDESFPGRNRWGEELRFKGGPTARYYEGEQYTSNQPKEYLPYALDNPTKPREDFPYSEFSPWNPDENFLSYNTAPTMSPPIESRGYYMNNAVGKEESTLFPSSNSWDHRIQVQRQRERRPYFNRNFWDQGTYLQKTPVSPPDRKENQPYFSNYPAGLQKNPTWHDGENLNYGVQITRLNSPERERLAYPDIIRQSYPSGQKEAHLFHLSQRRPCCSGGSPGPKDNPLALQDYTPSYGLGENQDTSPLYTEDSHTQHARHIISPTSIIPGQRNSSEKRLPGESQSPSPFRDDVSTLRRNTPCSIKNQLGQRGIMPFPEAGSLQSKNTPCLKSDLGGDGNNVLEQIFEDNQLNERAVDLTPEQLVIGALDEGPNPEGIQSEVQGDENERQQQRPSSILQLPCFSSELAKHHSSGPGTPSSNGRQDPFDGDPAMPTENPKTLVELATREQFQSINVDPHNAGEHSPFESLQRGTNPQDQVQDCLLLQT
ncbi:enamelin [Carlito syrichta]|uniref:Enamelin n=2 Tax=Carlito syrichta TaxID=1868482 RepID=A0A1U7TU87_CARSF|nr:enamelin [Carlito syrichta]